MLKKKEWLKRLKKLLIAKRILSPWDIQEALKCADEGWKKELSPGEAAKELNEHAEKWIHILHGGSIC